MACMRRVIHSGILAILSFAALAANAAAQTQSGSVEFVASATPTGGLEEPVRGFPFFLLSKSFEEINKEADASLPKPDMDAFIDKLEVSKELKAWMKKNHWVQLSGEDFIHKIKADDVMDVPEFFAAYLRRNSGYAATNFPKQKIKSSDAKDPEKAKKALADYRDAVRHYIEQNGDTIDGIDLELAQTDPSSKWSELQAKRGPELQRAALEMAQSKYLVARAQTNLEGQGSLTGIRPGAYWLSTLDVSANVGDARLRWDAPLNVRPGERARVTLSNVNAVQPSHNSP
jgi:hypothetical protein